MHNLLTPHLQLADIKIRYQSMLDISHFYTIYYNDVIPKFTCRI